MLVFSLDSQAFDKKDPNTLRTLLRAAAEGRCRIVRALHTDDEVSRISDKNPEKPRLLRELSETERGTRGAILGKWILGVDALGPWPPQETVERVISIVFGDGTVSRNSHIDAENFAHGVHEGATHFVTGDGRFFRPGLPSQLVLEFGVKVVTTAEACALVESSKNEVD